MLKRLLAIGVVGLGLGACTTTPEADLFVACHMLVATEQGLRPFKPKMSDDQIAIVQQSVNAAVPICTGGITDITDARAASRAVRLELARLLAVEAEVKGQ
jgi:hypothetical protein